MSALHSFTVTMLGLSLWAFFALSAIAEPAVDNGSADEMWANGQQMAREGERLMDRAEQQLVRGREGLKSGELLVSRGSDAAEQHRNDYRTAVQNGGQATTPSGLNTEVLKLRDIGRQWERAIQTIREGNRLIDKGNRTIADAKREIRRARALMEQGSLLMRNSERLRRGEPLLELSDTDPINAS